MADSNTPRAAIEWEYTKRAEEAKIVNKILKADVERLLGDMERMDREVENMKKQEQILVAKLDEYKTMDLDVRLKRVLDRNKFLECEIHKARELLRERATAAGRRELNPDEASSL